MDWSSQVFRYCERGSDPAFWAEPLNALSNAAFLIGALLAAWELARAAPRRAVAEWALVVLVAVIGAGSFLFHTFATRWASIADVAPIGVFMLAYLGYALRRLLGLQWTAVAIGLALFIIALKGSGDIACQRSGLLGIAAASRGPCLNGTLGYLPAFLAMGGIGLALKVQAHKASPNLLAAAGIFLASMALRTVDMELCDATRLGARTLGTHFLWHLLNATTLTLLLLAAVREGRPRSS